MNIEGQGQRELTLDEYVGRLVYSHIARRELAKLRAMQAEFDYLQDYVSDAEDALPEGYQTDVEHNLADRIRELAASKEAKP